jgi:hypothetical protein
MLCSQDNTCLGCPSLSKPCLLVPCRDKEEKKKKKKGAKGDKEDSPDPSATEGGEEDDEDDEVGCRATACGLLDSRRTPPCADTPCSEAVFHQQE